MITSTNLDTVLQRFQNQNYDKTQADITQKLKKICQGSKEFEAYIVLICIHIMNQNVGLADAISREFLAGMIVGILLEKEFGL